MPRSRHAHEGSSRVTDDWARIIDRSAVRTTKGCNEGGGKSLNAHIDSFAVVSRLTTREESTMDPTLMAEYAYLEGKIDTA
ncbi:hypothetical protein [Sorangium sp. So ce204]|uniref:hypothetical protein n=1 Tax=Sorangium sp. So ce204 TaxID=3133288 RepID=UPI003F5E70EB